MFQHCRDLDLHIATIYADVVLEDATLWERARRRPKIYSKPLHEEIIRMERYRRRRSRSRENLFFRRTETVSKESCRRTLGNLEHRVHYLGHIRTWLLAFENVSQCAGREGGVWLGW